MKYIEMFLKLPGFVASWLIMLTLTFFVLTPVGLVVTYVLGKQQKHEYRRSQVWTDNRRVLAFSPKWAWLWSNEEDGIDGHPLINGRRFKNGFWVEKSDDWTLDYTIFRWAGLRNPHNNLRFVPGFSFKPVASRVKSVVINRFSVSWHGIYSNIAYTTKKKLRFWLGWKIKPEDAKGYAFGDHRAYSTGFGASIRRQ